MLRPLKRMLHAATKVLKSTGGLLHDRRLLGLDGRKACAVGEELRHALALRVLRQVGLLALGLLGGCAVNSLVEVVAVRLSTADGHTRREHGFKPRILRVAPTLPHLFVLLVQCDDVDGHAVGRRCSGRTARTGSRRLFASAVVYGEVGDHVLRLGL